jgi:hypothetical protein
VDSIYPKAQISLLLKIQLFSYKCKFLGEHKLNLKYPLAQKLKGWPTFVSREIFQRIESLNSDKRS